jgi:hypothetical protein
MWAILGTFRHTGLLGFTRNIEAVAWAPAVAAAATFCLLPAPAACCLRLLPEPAACASRCSFCCCWVTWHLQSFTLWCSQLPRPLKYAAVLPGAGLEINILVPTSFCLPQPHKHTPLLLLLAAPTHLLWRSLVLPAPSSSPSKPSASATATTSASKAAHPAGTPWRPHAVGSDKVVLLLLLLLLPLRSCCCHSLPRQELI